VNRKGGKNDTGENDRKVRYLYEYVTLEIQFEDLAQSKCFQLRNEKCGSEGVCGAVSCVLYKSRESSVVMNA
jgi:hypothetical protein